MDYLEEEEQEIKLFSNNNGLFVVKEEPLPYHEQPELPDPLTYQNSTSKRGESSCCEEFPIENGSSSKITSKLRPIIMLSRVDNGDHSSKKQRSDSKCEECDDYFTNSYNLANHKKRHGFGAKCSHCRAEFSLNSFLIDHMKRKHGQILLQLDNKFRCGICQKPCGSKAKLESHLRIEHKICKVTIKKCGECGEDFTTRPWNFDSHTKSHGPGFKCSYASCGAEFSQFYTLRAHIDRIHHVELKRTRKALLRGHDCDECSDSFTSQAHLVQHKACHGTGFLCRSPNCGAEFWSKHGLAKHQKRLHSAMGDLEDVEEDYQNIKMEMVDPLCDPLEEGQICTNNSLESHNLTIKIEKTESLDKELEDNIFL